MSERCSDCNEYTYVDLFAGCGGLSEGFTQRGFIPIAKVEMNKDAADSLLIREVYHYLDRADRIDTYRDFVTNRISKGELLECVPESVCKTVRNEEISEDNAGELAEWIKSRLDVISKLSVDVIVAGLPCQSFSSVGRAKGNDISDPRNYLYWPFVKIVEELRPKICLVENVRGLETADGGIHFQSIVRLLKERGYRVTWNVLNAKEYGVLQNRSRLFIVSVRDDLQCKFDFPEKVTNSYSLHDIFDDIVFPDEPDYGLSYDDCSDYLKEFGIRKRGDVLFQNQASYPVRNQTQDQRIMKLCIQEMLKNGRMLLYSELPTELQTHKNLNKKSFQDRYRVLNPNGVSHTITAHISKDGHSHIYPDLEQLRYISLREASRIQSFPDDYFFSGSFTSQRKQVGNAVPPLLAGALADSVKRCLDSCI